MTTDYSRGVPIPVRVHKRSTENNAAKTGKNMKTEDNNETSSDHQPSENDGLPEDTIEICLEEGSESLNRSPGSPADGKQAQAFVESATEENTELAGLRERLLRTAADFDNYRKQTALRVEKARRQEQDRVLCGFLPVIDNLDRGLAAHEGEENPWVEGMRAIRKQMLDALRVFGASRFDCAKAEFDPQRHEAVARIPVQEGPENQVIEVIEPGYERDNGEVLRPAKVVVGYKPDKKDHRA